MGRCGSGSRAVERLVALARDTIRRHGMLAGGDHVLVAVSGGADSVALLHLLRLLAAELPLHLHVAHVDHRLRAASAEDACFVRELAHGLGVAVTVIELDVPGRGNLEEQARLARYRALDALATRLAVRRIAVGHTADDQAETVLMRLMQGAGPRGLAGIPAVRGRIVRPLVDARRPDIVAMLRAEGWPWREDPSNTDRRFLRNRIRHDVLPRLAAETPDVVEALTRTARLLRATVHAVEQLAAAELARLARSEPRGLTLPITRLRELPREVGLEVLRQAAVRLGGRAPLRGWAHRALARVLADPPPRRPFQLRGLIVEVSGTVARLASDRRPTVGPRSLVVPGATALPEVGLTIEARMVPGAAYEVCGDRDRAAFDADALPGPLRVRSRAPGDRLTPFRGPRRKLKALLIDDKIPRWERDSLPLVEAADEIVWVVGLRRGAAAPVTATTRTVLELHVRRMPPVADGPAPPVESGPSWRP